MKQFSARTTIVGIVLTTLLSLSMFAGDLTSTANKSIGKATITIYENDNHLLNANVEQFVGWKIFKWKIWKSVGKVVVAAASAAASYLAVDAINGPNDPQKKLYFDQETKIRHLILMAELD